VFGRILARHFLVVFLFLMAVALPALAAEAPAHGRFLLGISASEGVGGFDSGLGGTYATFVPAPSVRVSRFLDERLEVGGGLTHQEAPFHFSGSACIGPWNEVFRFSFADVAVRYNFSLGKTGFWFVTGGVIGGVVVHHFHDYKEPPGHEHGVAIAQPVSSGERGSSAFGAKVQTGGGTWITPSLRWSAGLEFYMGYTLFQFLGDTQPAPFGQLSAVLGVDFGLF
jgi:hypothetical protein